MRYKRAALKDHLGKITGTSAGALAGGLGGYGIASLFSDNKSIRILAALAGALGGGYGGYSLGNYMDTQRAGLIDKNDDLTSKNDDLTNKYNDSQDKLLATTQQRDEARGQRDLHKSIADDLALKEKQLQGRLAYGEQLLQRSYTRQDELDAIANAAVAKQVEAQNNNIAAANKMNQMQAVIDLFLKHIHKNQLRRIYDFEQNPLLLRYL